MAIRSLIYSIKEKLLIFYFQFNLMFFIPINSNILHFFTSFIPIIINYKLYLDLIFLLLIFIL